jgi:ferritin-like metal-binding protein YciE
MLEMCSSDLFIFDWDSMREEDGPMAMHSLEDLFVEKLKDIYDAERRITKALPKMAKNAGSEELSSAFEEHLQQTEGQIERLDQIFEKLGKTPGRKICHGMVGLLEEGKELMEEDAPEPVMDAGLISAAQEVEHYEIGAYGTLKTWADMLGKNEEARLLQESLEEEEQTDEKLTQIAKTVNDQAMQGQEFEDEEETVMVGAHRSGSSSRGGNSRSGRGGNSRGRKSRAR